MEEYTEKIDSQLKTKIKDWTELAHVAYNIGVIRSCEAVIFHDMNSDKNNIFFSDKKDEIAMSKEIMDYLSNGDSQLVLIHNHNGKETCFSNRDIEVLLDYPRIIYMMVINSKHEIYILAINKQAKSREEIMKLFWDWWSTAERKVKLESIKIVINAPAGRHAVGEEFASLLEIEDEVMKALHNMTEHKEFIKFAKGSGFFGAYLYN